MRASEHEFLGGGPMIGIVRVLFAVIIVNGLLNELVMDFFFDSRVVPVITAAWMAVGYFRVFGRPDQAASMRQAFKGVITALLWPLLPTRRT